MHPRVHYRVEISTPSSHRIDVEVTIHECEETLTLSLPVWTPGSYMVRDYAQYLQDVRCVNAEGAPLPFIQLDKSTWQVDSTGEKTVCFAYTLYANQLTVRTNHVDDSHGFICGAATFMAVEGRTAEPLAVSLGIPEHWQVATPLKQDNGGHWVAGDFDLLVDSPIEVGIHHRVNFEALGKPHSYVFWGDGNWDEEAVVRDTIAIVEETAKHYDGTLPYEEYMFIVHAARGIRGGLEHLNSTVLAWDTFGFQPLSAHEDFMRLVAHEFYHTWNVKRTRPRVLGPFDYSRENYTKMLWLHEGGTVYYEGLIPMRSGTLRLDSWLKEMAKSVHTLRTNPGRKHQSVAESSFNAWTKLYKRNEHSQNSMISYYLKGELVCVCLDKLIRESTAGQKSLDDVMRLFYARSAPPHPGFLDDDVAPWIAEVAGVDVKEFLAAYVDGLDPLPLEETFAWYGLHLYGKVDDLGEKGDGASLDVKTVASANRAKIVYVDEEGVGFAAGLQYGDEIIALDGYQVNHQSLEDRLKMARPGQVVTLTLFRRERLREFSVSLGERPFDSFVLEPLSDASPEQRARFESLLGVPFPVSGASA